MALQNARKIHHQENQQLSINASPERTEYAYGVLTMGQLSGFAKQLDATQLNGIECSHLFFYVIDKFLQSQFILIQSINKVRSTQDVVSALGKKHSFT